MRARVLALVLVLASAIGGAGRSHASVIAPAAASAPSPPTAAPPAMPMPRVIPAEPAPSTASPTAAPKGLYGRAARPSLDGIGKTYMGREIAQVMGWQGAEWLEREEREKEERSDLLMKELRLRPGMRVADIGAGTGYYSRRLAEAVGPSGRVFAVDVQPEMLEMLEQGARKAGLANIEPVLGDEDEVKLAPSSIDLAIMVDVYHELEYPYEVLASIVRALKPGGRVVFVEYRLEDSFVPIKALHRMSQAQIRREAAVHPLAWERTSRALPWQHVVVFRKQAAAASRVQ